MRKKEEFWLKRDDPLDEWLIDTIAVLKRQRQFVRVVRDGIRLILALRAGDIEVLFEMFPWTRYQQAPPPQPPPYRPYPNIPGDLMSQIEDVIAETFESIKKAS